MGEEFVSTMLSRSLAVVGAFLSSSPNSLEKDYRDLIATAAPVRLQRELLWKLSPFVAAEARMKGTQPLDVIAGIRTSAAALADAGTPPDIDALLLQAGEMAAQNAPDIEGELQIVNAEIRLAVRHAMWEKSSRELHLLRTVLQKPDREPGLPSILAAELSSAFRASAVALFTRTLNEIRILAHTGDIHEYSFTHADPFSEKVHLIATAGERASELVLLPDWLRSFETVWSVHSGTLVAQLAFASDRQPDPGDLDLICALLRHASSLSGAEAALRMFELSEAERYGVGRTLHDHPAQALALMRLHLEMLPSSIPEDASEARSNVGEIREITEKLIHEVRNLISDLRIPDLKRHGLSGALRHLTERFGHQTSASASVEAADLADTDLRLQKFVYRVVQACLSDMARQSGIKKVKVSVAGTDKALRLTLECTRKVLEKKDLKASESAGLPDEIQQRIALIGGKAEIRNTLTGGHKESVRRTILIEFPHAGEYPGYCSL